MLVSLRRLYREVFVVVLILILIVFVVVVMAIAARDRRIVEADAILT